MWALPAIHKRVYCLAKMTLCYDVARIPAFCQSIKPHLKRSVDTFIVRQTYCFSRPVKGVSSFFLPQGCWPISYCLETIFNFLKMYYINFYIHCNLYFISPLPVFTPEGTIGLPSVRPSVCQSVCPSVCLSAKNLDPFIT